MTYFYTDEKVQASLEKHYSACHEEPTQSSPALEIEEGFILSPKIVRNERGILTWEAGVFDKQKQYVPNTSMREIPFENLTFPTNCEQVDKTVIWGGLLYDHYGHFLLQSTTRLYYYLKHNPNNFPIVFAVYNTKIARYIWDFFELCHIAKDKVIFLDKTTQFKKIICPPISMEYEKNYNSNFLLPFRTAA